MSCILRSLFLTFSFKNGLRTGQNTILFIPHKRVYFSNFYHFSNVCVLGPKVASSVNRPQVTASAAAATAAFAGVLHIAGPIEGHKHIVSVKAKTILRSSKQLN